MGFFNYKKGYDQNSPFANNKAIFYLMVFIILLTILYIGSMYVQKPIE
jgi:hypothetical protein